MMKSTKPLLIVLTGCTAAGKSDIAVHLAKKINGKIITADSTQLIKQISILSNKSPKTHDDDLINALDGFEINNVVNYSNMAHKTIEKISKTNIPIIEGGTFFYIKNLLDGNLVFLMPFMSKKGLF